MRSATTDIALFRKQCSISQEDMAAYLGISYSALAMHEREERPLATKALIKFGELLTAYEKNKKAAKRTKPLPAVQVELDKQHEEAVAKMQDTIIDQGRRVQMLQHKLRSIIVKQEGFPAWLQIIDQKLATLPNKAAGKGDRQALEEMHARACAGMVKNNEKKLKLQLSIALLEAELRVYENYRLMLNKQNKK